MGGLSCILEDEAERETWRMNVADNLWMIAMQRTVTDETKWRPYSELILSQKKKAQNKEPKEIINDLIHGFDKIAESEVN